MHRHPQRDNTLRPRATEIMALKSRDRDRLRVYPPLIIHHSLDPHPHTHTVCSLQFCSVSCLYRGSCSCAKAPVTPPPSTPTQSSLLFACLEFSSWLRGPGWGAKYTSQHYTAARTESCIDTHTLFLRTCTTLDGCLQILLSSKETKLLMGPSSLADYTTTHHGQECITKTHGPVCCYWETLSWETGKYNICTNLVDWFSIHSHNKHLSLWNLSCFVFSFLWFRLNKILAT